jgi:hypothetical protein
VTKLPTVVCVLRSGGDYGREHVRALFAGVARRWPRDLPLRFVALTDASVGSAGIEERPLRTGWPGWWSKMELFLAEHDDLGDMLYFDLDTMVVGPLDAIARVGRLTLLRDFYHRRRVQSGMMYLPAAERPYACAAWVEDPDGVVSRHRGDGQFLHELWRGKADRWQDSLPGQVVSYKVHVRQRKGPTIPAGACVVCFHGRPRPWTTPLWGRE